MSIIVNRATIVSGGGGGGSFTPDDRWAEFLGVWDPATNSPPISDGAAAGLNGGFYHVSKPSSPITFNAGGQTGSFVVASSGELISNGSRWFWFPDVPADTFLESDGSLLDGEFDASGGVLPAANLNDWFEVATSDTIGGVLFSRGEWWQATSETAGGSTAAIAAQWTKRKNAPNAQGADGVLLDGQYNIPANGFQLPAASAGDWIEIGTPGYVGTQPFLTKQRWKATVDTLSGGATVVANWTKIRDGYHPVNGPATTNPVSNNVPVPGSFGLLSKVAGAWIYATAENEDKACFRHAQFVGGAGNVWQLLPDNIDVDFTHVFGVTPADEFQILLDTGGTASAAQQGVDYQFFRRPYQVVDSDTVHLLPAIPGDTDVAAIQTQAVDVTAGNLAAGPPQVVTLNSAVPAGATVLLTREPGGRVAARNYSIAGDQLTWDPVDANPLQIGDHLQLDIITSISTVAPGGGSEDPNPKATTIGTASETLTANSKQFRTYRVTTGDIVLTLNGIGKHVARVTEDSNKNFAVEYRLPDTTLIKRIIAGERVEIAQDENGNYDWF